MDPLSQQLLFTLGGSSKTTYIDDVFSTYLYTGNQTAGHTITNGIDLSGKGGMTWIKSRTNAAQHEIVDTVRGAGYKLKADGSSAQESSTSSELDQFNSDGFRLAYRSAGGNALDMDYASWSFRKQKGFFDIVTYTGNGTAGRTVSHSLGCEPGMIIIKNLSSSEDWRVYHRSLGGTHNLVLNSNGSAAGTTSVFNQTDPTASVFTVGTSDATNKNNDNFVAYLFAGGASTAATARSVDLDNSGDTLTLASSTDFTFDGDFTVEGWFYSNAHSSHDALWGLGRYSGASPNDGIEFYYSSTGVLNFYAHGGDKMYGPKIKIKQWTHIAVVRSGSKVTMYVDGLEVDNYTESSDFGSNGNNTFNIGSAKNSSSNNVDEFNGKISNFRVVKGTAVYTSSFRPPTEPLTNIPNTVLLCCNNASVTGSTVTPGTITDQGNSTASTDSPFDDPAGFKFGEEGDQNIVKCGTYVGNTTTGTYPEINLGFEPQWFLTKRTNGGGDWILLDSMRGIVADGNDPVLSPNSSAVESTAGGNLVDLTPTGLKLLTNYDTVNGHGDTYTYIAIRRPDGLVGKPPEAGTDTFAMDVGSNNFPAFDSNFAVDFVLQKAPDAGANWLVPSRLTGSSKYLKTNNTDNEASWDVFDFDSNVGWGKASTWASATNNAWMWKRHAGFDVATYVGNSTGSYSGMSQVISHNLGKVPEMIWCKNRDASGYWGVYHKGLNGGTNPENYRLLLNDTHAESAASGSYTNWYWNNTAPTATHFSVGEVQNANANNTQIIAMLFASVEGISKVGSYTGNGYASGPTITLGFAPRFILIKCVSAGGTNWFVYDTLRGLTSGNDQRLLLNDTSNQVAADDIDPSATGFQVVSTWDQLNDNNAKYIYYAHV